MQYYQNDITKIVEQFQERSSPTDRYASFDYCYLYFKKSSSAEILKDMEKSCLVLGFYLASWGMLRGSSFLLEHSAKYYEPLIEYIASLDKSVWEIDVDNYTDENIEIILEIYEKCKEILIKNKNSHLTLITKILMGVFGFIPAFDRFFCDSFREISLKKCRYRSFNRNALENIRQFYVDNSAVIDKLASELQILEFATGTPSEFTYTKAKIIDMYGFMKGLNP